MPSAVKVAPTPVTNNSVAFHMGGQTVRYSYSSGEFQFHTPRVGEVVTVNHDDAGQVTRFTGRVDRVESGFFSSTAGTGSVSCVTDVFLS